MLINYWLSTPKIWKHQLDQVTYFIERDYDEEVKISEDDKDKLHDSDFLKGQEVEDDLIKLVL